MEQLLCDIHSHIAYGIDDGALDINESMQLIKASYDQGIRKQFLTSHSYCMEIDRYNRAFNSLNNALSDMSLDFKIYKGCEVLCYPHIIQDIIQKLDDGELLSMNDTKYILTEFNWFIPNITLDGVRFCVSELLSAGYVPIIAHAERYIDIYDDPISNIKELKSYGSKIQVNYYSVSIENDPAIKKIATNLLQNELVDFMGSDTHRMNFRPPHAKDAYGILASLCESSYLDRITRKNTEELLM